MRHELKYILSPVQYHLLRGRLLPFLQRDEHTDSEGNYFVRSIYFDSDDYRALQEKNSGINSRRKYRLRFYNGNARECQVECKIKKGTRIEKTHSIVTSEEVEGLLKGNVAIGDCVPQGPFGELVLLEKNEHFRPLVVVDYLREAYVYPLSGLRITFDKEISAGKIEDCLERRRGLANVLPSGHVILEVKYNNYLPEHISKIIAGVRPVQTAASKYVMCTNEKMEGRIL